MPRCTQCSGKKSSVDDHDLCPQCRVQSDLCAFSQHEPCEVCLLWSTRTWKHMRKLLRDSRAKARTRDSSHWSDRYPHLVEWADTLPSSDRQEDLDSVLSQVSSKVSQATGDAQGDSSPDEPKVASGDRSLCGPEQESKAQGGAQGIAPGSLAGADNPSSQAGAQVGAQSGANIDHGAWSEPGAWRQGGQWRQVGAWRQGGAGSGASLSGAWPMSGAWRQGGAGSGAPQAQFGAWSGAPQGGGAWSGAPSLRQGGAPGPRQGSAWRQGGAWRTPNAQQAYPWQGAPWGMPYGPWGWSQPDQWGPGPCFQDGSEQLHKEHSKSAKVAPSLEVDQVSEIAGGSVDPEVEFEGEAFSLKPPSSVAVPSAFNSFVDKSNFDMAPPKVAKRSKNKESRFSKFETTKKIEIQPSDTESASDSSSSSESSQTPQVKKGSKQGRRSSASPRRRQDRTAKRVDKILHSSSFLASMASAIAKSIDKPRNKSKGKSKNLPVSSSSSSSSSSEEDQDIHSIRSRASENGG